MIGISSIGWETEIVNLKISISENHIFDFKVDVERLHRSIVVIQHIMR